MEIIWIIVFYLYTISGYFWFSSQTAPKHTMTPWDKYIPTLPIFIIPYLFATLAFLTVPVIFYLKLGWIKTKAYLITQALATTIGYVIYYFWPTSVVRVGDEGGGILGKALKILHANDGTSASFPSGHVYHTTVIAYFVWQYFPTLRPYVVIILPLVIASTVLLKQHYLPDILGGLAAATISILTCKYFFKII